MAVGTSTDDADEGDELLAQERQPVPEQRVGARQDGAHHGARSLLGVVADRQDDGVLEGLPERGEAPAMGEPVGDTATITPATMPNRPSAAQMAIIHAVTVPVVSASTTRLHR